MDGLRNLFDTLIEYHWSSIEMGEFTVLNACEDPLSVLVAIVLSQNTNDVNSTRAYRSLAQRVGCPMKPESILEMSVEELAEVIRVSGMHHIKARTIVNLVKSVSVEELVKLDPLELRSRLLAIRGIGYKTADVFLLMYRKFPVFPIDTHIRRVLTRYGVVRRGDSYEAIRRTVENYLPEDPDYLTRAHLSLIKHGRAVCRARKPLCEMCPVSSWCAKIV
ncbi:MAG: hypothetical protein RMH84_02160 [Sulfolobales archaeon]|nr:hypothetical protein [Sulfolobales archaeon]MCX8208541.1 hypothetical protein [Sulfolobales archaeon]MDW8010382.1 hypothetical protein [Sulfolobales archaeon]